MTVKKKSKPKFHLTPKQIVKTIRYALYYWLLIYRHGVVESIAAMCYIF